MDPHPAQVLPLVEATINNANVSSQREAVLNFILRIHMVIIRWQEKPSWNRISASRLREDDYLSIYDYSVY